MKNKKGGIGIALLLLVIVAFLIVMTVGIPYQTTRNGSHTGIITAVEENGFIFKTVTVYVKTDAQSSQEDQYCLKDKSLIDSLKEFEKSKVQVTVYFNNNVLNGWANCNGEEAVITGAEQ
jgi:hypothetical protein